MKILINIVCLFLLTACGGGHYRYQAESDSAQWQGQNIQAVEKAWGGANDIMHTRSGTSYYVYLTNSTANFFRSTTTSFNSDGSLGAGRLNNQVGLKCTTIFVTDKNGMITNVKHQGNNCGGAWVSQNPHS